MPLTDKLKKTAKPKKKPTTPVWKGPEEDGVTFSLLSRFLVCRERFRLLVVEGLKPTDAFNARMEYGNMWHACEEALAAKADWTEALAAYANSLCLRYPLDREQIDHWWGICRSLFPLYVEHWAQHPDVAERTPLLQEQVFDVPYRVPSGRTVRLRGKWDSVDLIGKGKDAGTYFQENKSKSQVDPVKIQQQMLFDLQTMMYLIAFPEWREQNRPGPSPPLRGVRYNVVRRPAHKSVESMLKKVGDDRKANRIGEWFSRWKVEITPGDIQRFRHECLDPILEQLCEWWDWVQRPPCKGGTDHYDHVDGIHWRTPYGIYNVLLEGGSSEMDHYLASGSEAGLQRTSELFPELA